MRMRRRGAFAVALAVILGVGNLGLSVRRSARREEMAAKYAVAAARFDEYAKAYQSRLEGGSASFSSGYGGRWDQFTRQVDHDVISHAGEKDYLRRKAAFYTGLKQQYEKAEGNPDPGLSPDPPEPE